MHTSLNPTQREAVTHHEGPLLVLAGAGTGKTKVLTHRIADLVFSNKAQLNQILAVTFTNKAASEMKRRVAALIPGSSEHDYWIGTFHSIAVKILRRHSDVIGLKSDFTILDEDDQLRLLKQIMNDLNIDAKQFPPKSYLNLISRAKDSAKRPADVDTQTAAKLYKFREVYERYQQRLTLMNAADFGDLTLLNLEIFAKDPKVLELYQQRFRYILVDEYQDTNSVQYQWLLKLAASEQNICCVGDDDQSIYSWRGAEIKNILNFERDFKGAKIIRLEQNYRSTKNVLTLANQIIGDNKFRHGKSLWTEVEGGEKVRITPHLDDRMESESIVNLIKHYQITRRYHLSQIAILVRSSYLTRQFEESFLRNMIPYKIIGGAKFYERMEIKDAIAYLRVSFNPSDNMALLRIINSPKRGIGEAAINGLSQIVNQQQIPLFAAIKHALSQNMIRSKAALATLIEQIGSWNSEASDANPVAFAQRVLDESGYLKRWQNELGIEAEGRVENLKEFVASLAQFSTLAEFLEYVSLFETRENDSNMETVNVMTVHGAKGMEFDLVFIPGLEEGVFPSNKSIEENRLEEERRILYVAITRARKELHLSYARTRYVYGNYQVSTPSRFLNAVSKL